MRVEKGESVNARDSEALAGPAARSLQHPRSLHGNKNLARGHIVGG